MKLSQLLQVVQEGGFDQDRWGVAPECRKHEHLSRKRRRTYQAMADSSDSDFEPARCRDHNGPGAACGFLDLNVHAPVHEPHDPCLKKHRSNNVHHGLPPCTKEFVDTFSGIVSCLPTLVGSEERKPHAFFRNALKKQLQSVPSCSSNSTASRSCLAHPASKPKPTFKSSSPASKERTSRVHHLGKVN